jgi:hypothetical protein
MFQNIKMPVDLTLSREYTIPSTQSFTNANWSINTHDGKLYMINNNLTNTCYYEFEDDSHFTTFKNKVNKLKEIKLVQTNGNYAIQVENTEPFQMYKASHCPLNVSQGGAPTQKYLRCGTTMIKTPDGKIRALYKKGNKHYIKQKIDNKMQYTLVKR